MAALHQCADLVSVKQRHRFTAVVHSSSAFLNTSMLPSVVLYFLALSSRSGASTYLPGRRQSGANELLEKRAIMPL